MERAWLDESNPNSLVAALFKCLKESPVDARKDVIGNLLVCGDTAVLVPDLGRRLALKVKRLLQSKEGEEAGPASPSSVADELAMTMVPVATQQLKPLADHIGVISCAPYRADLISWVGGSVYSAIWHRHDDDDTHMNWVFSPASASK